jgi:hypothetical protein
MQALIRIKVRTSIKTVENFYALRDWVSYEIFKYLIARTRSYTPDKKKRWNAAPVFSGSVRFELDCTPGDPNLSGIWNLHGAAQAVMPLQPG